MTRLTYSVFFRRLGYAATLFLALACFISAAAHAMKVAPAVIEMYIPLGGVYTGEFVATNTSAEPAVIAVEFEDETEWERVRSNPEEAIEKPARWLTLDQTELELEAGESGRFPYRVTVPEGGVQGELKGHVFFEQRSAHETGTAVSLVARIGNAVYVVIRGTEDIRGEITDFSLAEDSRSLDVNIQNLGNTHIRPKGTIRLEHKDAGDTDFKDVDELAVNERGQPLMLDGAATFRTLLPSPLFSGTYRASVEVEFGNPAVVLTGVLDFTVPE